MQILKMGAQELRLKAQPVRDIGKQHQELAQKMLDVLHKHKGVGLAGPQVGVMERIYVVHIDKDEPRVFINPSLIETSEELASIEEGCLSVPGVWSEIMRPRYLRVQAWNEKGRPFTLDASGLLARVILHECDHLEGLLFVDRLEGIKRERLIAKYEKLRRHRAKRGTGEPSGTAP